MFPVALYALSEYWSDMDCERVQFRGPMWGKMVETWINNKKSKTVKFLIPCHGYSSSELKDFQVLSSLIRNIHSVPQI